MAVPSRASDPGVVRSAVTQCRLGPSAGVPPDGLPPPRGAVRLRDDDSCRARRHGTSCLRGAGRARTGQLRDIGVVGDRRCGDVHRDPRGRQARAADCPARVADGAVGTVATVAGGGTRARGGADRRRRRPGRSRCGLADRHPQAVRRDRSGGRGSGWCAGRAGRRQRSVIRRWRSTDRDAPCWPTTWARGRFI